MAADPKPPRSVEHETFVLERRYPAEPGRVFAAWAEPEARLRWSPPSADQTIEYLETDFRVGGRDVSRCGPAGDPRFRVDARYLDIVPNRRIVFTERVGTGETALSVSLITVEIAPDGEGTRLILTDQIASLDGADMVSGSRHGLSAALDNLAEELSRARGPAEGG